MKMADTLYRIETPREEPMRPTHWIVPAFCAAALLPAALSSADPTAADWPNPGNDKAGTRYSTLEQINRGNVSKLKVAWTYRTGDAGTGTTIECTPLVVDGVMYVTTVLTKVVALDPTSGKEIWKFDPFADPSRKFNKASGGVNRGVAYWSDGRPDGERRVILGSADGRIISLDAKSGKPDVKFGVNGEVDLRAGVPEATGQPYGPTSPPMVYENLVIVGCSTNESSPTA